MGKITRVFVLFLISSTFILGCNGDRMDGKKPAYHSVREVSASTWKSLSGKRIYFGHQSVGANILEGMRDVMEENPQIELNLVEMTDPSVFNTPAFAHSKVGKNTDPKSKCRAFSDLLNRGIGSKIDIALLKFCYIDVTTSTDVDEVFQEYRNTVASLRQKFPHVVFIHLTVPLTTIETGIKASIKRIIGMKLNGYDENIRREELNTKLRAEYGKKEPLLDIAQLESTYPDGTRLTFTAAGRTYSSMVPEYTDDGGHLNQKGRRIVAEQLLVLLANQAQ